MAQIISDGLAEPFNGDWQQFITPNPADFIERHVYDPDVGLLTLHPEQRAVLEAMAARTPDGLFQYSTWLYSAPKKSVKTTIGGGVALWQAWQQANGEIYIIGNDQRQADNRMAQIIRHTIQAHPTMRQFVKVTQSSYKIEFANGTRLDIVPVDPRGEAGMNPTGLFWTEAWGAIGERAERMWSEAVLSPTRYGRAFRFVESYAGFSGQSLILERLYDAIVTNGVPHESVPELYTNGGMIGYWCTRRYLDWQQNPTYYQEEEATKTPSEFRRQHHNEWQSSEGVFVPSEWWDACEGDVPDLLPTEQWVIALDAAVSGDCFAMVGVNRRGEQVYERFTRVWYPPKGGKIDFSAEDGPERELERLCRTYPVAQVCYDPYQLHDMATRLSSKGIAWFEEFPQGADRLIADKQLFDTIRDRRLTHSGDPTLRAHVLNANRKDTGEQDKLRIIKRADHLKIDAAVALSMASYRARYLWIG